jgi:tetrapyrrole methylase family protein / MazG family protein
MKQKPRPKKRRAACGPLFDELVAIMSRLRDKRRGCPWDLEQTHRSLIPYLTEESGEVIQTIEDDTPKALCEELGDLLLQIVFHAQLAKEEKSFDIRDVVSSINQKLIRRHPHVFASTKATSADEVLKNWHTIKKSEGKLPASALENVPRSLPALFRAFKISKIVCDLGFDWPTIADLRKKVIEELGELEEAHHTGAADNLEDEFGDLLFTLVNYARKFKIDPEIALQRTNRKFIHRFAVVEKEAVARYGSVKGATLEQLDALWNEAKKTTR